MNTPQAQKSCDRVGVGVNLTLAAAIVLRITFGAEMCITEIVLHIAAMSAATHMALHCRKIR